MLLVAVVTYLPLSCCAPSSLVFSLVTSKLASIVFRGVINQQIIRAVHRSGHTSRVGSGRVSETQLNP